MADYFCKDCGHNNHGWCRNLQKQGLKDIKACEHKELQNKNKDKNK